MQTFLVEHSFADTMNILDYRRLGKQRVEAKQILKALGYYPHELMSSEELETYLRTPHEERPWRNHPAVRMWDGFPIMLAAYHNAAIREWTSRGYTNNMPLIDTAQMQNNGMNSDAPWWNSSSEFHKSHKSNLLRKDPEYYSQFGWDVPDDLPYMWPTPQQQPRLPRLRPAVQPAPEPQQPHPDYPYSNGQSITTTATPYTSQTLDQSSTSSSLYEYIPTGSISWS